MKTEPMAGDVLPDMRVPAVENAAERVAAFVAVFNAGDVADYVRDLKTQVSHLHISGHHFPITLNDYGDGNMCYLNSPTRAYIDYAKDELRNFDATPAVKGLLSAVISGVSPCVRMMGLERQVQINNWLFSTNPIPRITIDTALALRDRLKAQHPQHALIIRSLNDRADAETRSALRQAGFIFLPARQVYIVDREDALSKSMKEDQRKIAKSKFRYVGNSDFSQRDYARAETLYRMLYIEKYTDLNPHYSAHYIEHMHKTGLMELEGFRGADGELVAVTGYFENGTTLTQPIVGYDTSLPSSEGLYRMIMSLGQSRAIKGKLFFNMSAGAADFKRRRNATPEIEYTAVFCRHLPLQKRVAIWALSRLLHLVGIPIMRKFEL